MQRFYLLLLLSIPVIAADTQKDVISENHKEDLCLNALRDFPIGKAILASFARRDLPQIDTRPVTSRTYSDSTSELRKQKEKKRSLSTNLLKKRSKEIHTKDKDNGNIDSLLMSLRFNVFMGDIYGTDSNEFIDRASKCIEYLEGYCKLEKSHNQALTLPPMKEKDKKKAEDDEEMDKLLTEIRKKENDSRQALVNEYKKIVDHQKKGMNWSLSQLGSDVPKIVSELYNYSEHSDDLFDTIDLVLMRAAEIFMKENNWNKKEVKAFEGLVPTIVYYRSQKFLKIHPPTNFRSPLKVEEILDKQKKLKLPPVQSPQPIVENKSCAKANFDNEEKTSSLINLPISQQLHACLLIEAADKGIGLDELINEKLIK